MADDLTPPTPYAIIAGIQGDMAANIKGAQAQLPRSFLGALAIVWGLALRAVYGYVHKVSNIFLPQTSWGQFLVNLGGMKGVTPKGTQAWAGTVAFINGTAWAPIPSDTVLVRGDGATFQTVGAGALGAGGSGTVNVVAIVPGSNGNTAVGVTMQLQSPLPGVPSSGTVSASTTPGLDAEVTTAFRGRVMNRWAAPPQGGCGNDYVQWVLQLFPAATRAWTYPQWQGVGTVGVCFVEDNNPAGIIPSGGDVAAVQALIGIFGTTVGPRPVCATVVVFAPTALPQAMTIHLNPSNATTQAAVTAALAAAIAADAIPGGSISLGPGVFPISHLDDAIGNAAGVNDWTLSVPAPPGTIAIAPGQLLQLGAITWD